MQMLSLAQLRDADVFSLDLSRSGVRYASPFEEARVTRLTFAGQTTLDQPPGPNTRLSTST